MEKYELDFWQWIYINAFLFMELVFGISYKINYIWYIKVVKT